MPDVFLSYSREDQVTARRFADALQREGFSVWWDQALDAGESFDKVTEQALKDAKAVVVLWSKKAVDSRWVRSEATLADRYGTLVPVMIEPCDRPIMFELTHTADFSNWNGDAAAPPWRAFIDGLRRTLGKTATSPTFSPVFKGSATPPRRGLMIAAALAALMIGTGLVWLAQHRGSDDVQTATSVAARTGPITLAVLPFADLSQAGDQEYFSDGLTEEILNQLAQTRELRVTGRTSSFSFKGKNVDLRKIADQLGVENLLEGSVRKDGDNLRITAQLIDGRDGAHLWSKTYARELKQVFTVQEEIARDVAQALSVTLDIGESSRATGGTTNVAAYEKYLQARALTLQGGSIEAVRMLLREAVSLDPEFSRAWLALGTNLGSAAVVASPSVTDNLRKERDSALERGITLAPDTYGAQNVRITMLLDEQQWNEAGAQFANLPDVAEYRGRLQVEVGGILSYPAGTGRLSEAIETLNYVVQLEPLSLVVSVTLQTFLTASGEFDAAQTEYLRSQPLVGNHFRADYRALLRLLYQDAEPETVQTELRRQLNSQRMQDTQGEEGAQTLVRKVIESLADRPAALQILRQSFENRGNHNQVILTVIYQLADALDDRDLALSALRMLVLDLDSPVSLWMAPHSGVRTDPRFKDLLRETGLAQHYRTTGNWGDFCKPVGETDFECI